MAIITLTTDMGTRDHYVAALKAKILMIDIEAKIVDITHDIEHYNISHAAYVLKAVYGDFPKGTIHLLSVGAHDNAGHKYLAAKIEEYYFTAPDNGVLSLLYDGDIQARIISDATANTPFPEKNIMAVYAAKLSVTPDIDKIGKPYTNIKKLLQRNIIKNKNIIKGCVIHGDIYGNCVTNITFKDFDEICAGRKYLISFGRNTAENINNHYYEIEHGQYGLIFNDAGNLEIFIQSGSAKQLLGLRYDISDATTVSVSFFPDI
ncbi:MAG: SAM-dependent chlorinase/fluorinase [Cytophagales bacterium]|nr:SAM-dependent chlorinase/fluorinase [Cytophagales bacterium]